MLLPFALAFAVLAASQLNTSAQQQEGGAAAPAGRGAGPAGRQGAPSTARGEGGGAPARINGVAGSTPPTQNRYVNRPLTNEGISSSAMTHLWRFMGSYGNIANANDLPNPYKRVEPWGELPANYEGQMPSPIGAETNPAGEVVALLRCRNNGCEGQPQDPIVIWDRQGKLLRAFGAGMYDGPHGMTVDKDGNVWTADQGNHLVRKWSTDGKLLMSIGTENKSTPPGPNVLFQPTDVAVDADGFVYITEGHEKVGTLSRVSKYSPTGQFVKYLTRPGRDGIMAGNSPTQVSAPHSLAIDIRGRLFISDRDNNRLLIMDREGNYIQEWRQFSRPSGVYITQDDRIYVFDSESWGPDNPGWSKGVRVGNAYSGVVNYYLRDAESQDYTHSGPEGGGVDSDGNIYAAVVRRMQMERHEPPKPQPTRNAAWGPYQPLPQPAYPAPPAPPAAGRGGNQQ